MLTGKTHIALGLGLAACQKGLSVGFLTAAALVHELMEARDEKRLLRLQKQLAKYHLLIIDELGFVPLSKTGAELLFEVFSQRYERGSILVTSNLPFDEWTEIFGSERLTGALLDRLTHHVHILEMNGESYRLNQSQKRRKSPKNNRPMVAGSTGNAASPVTQALLEAMDLTLGAGDRGNYNNHMRKLWLLLIFQHESSQEPARSHRIEFAQNVASHCNQAWFSISKTKSPSSHASRAERFGQN